jgi:hypothetical protein
VASAVENRRRESRRARFPMDPSASSLTPPEVLGNGYIRSIHQPGPAAERRHNVPPDGDDDHVSMATDSAGTSDRHFVDVAVPLAVPGQRHAAAQAGYPPFHPTRCEITE